MDINKRKFDILCKLLPSIPLLYKEAHSDMSTIAYEDGVWVWFDMFRTRRVDHFKAAAFDEVAEYCLSKCYNGETEAGISRYKEVCEAYWGDGYQRIKQESVIEKGSYSGNSNRFSRRDYLVYFAEDGNIHVNTYFDEDCDDYLGEQHFDSYLAGSKEEYENMTLKEFRNRVDNAWLTGAR